MVYLDVKLMQTHLEQAQRDAKGMGPIASEVSKVNNDPLLNIHVLLSIRGQVVIMYYL